MTTKITELEFEDTIYINPIDISNALNVLFFKMGPSLASTNLLIMLRQLNTLKFKTVNGLNPGVIS